MKDFKRWLRFQLQMINLHKLKRREKSFIKFCIEDNFPYDNDRLEEIDHKIEQLNNRRLQNGIN